MGTKTEKVMAQVEVILERFNRLLSEQNLNNIEMGLDNFSKSSGEFYGLLKEARGEIFQIGKVRDSFDQSLKAGDYNLRLILTPLLFELQQNSKALQHILQKGNGILDDFRDSPSGFLFDSTKVKLGPRE